MVDNPATSHTLLERVRLGSEGALLELRTLYTPLVYYWCRRSGIQARDAEEVWSNVMGSVSSGVGGFQHNGRKGAFRKWLKRITYNEIADFLAGPRGAGGSDGQNSLLQIANTDDDEAATSKSETYILYLRAWEIIRSEFSERDNEIFRRVAENGEAPKDVADDMRLKRTTVYTTVFRIRTCVRERFSGVLDL